MKDVIACPKTSRILKTVTNSKKIYAVALVVALREKSKIDPVIKIRKVLPTLEAALAANLVAALIAQSNINQM